MTYKTIRIGHCAIGSQEPVFIIAEAGVNHNGDIALARKLVQIAKECGADCIKFQTFKAERVASVAAPKAEYQLHTTDRAESQLEMLQKLELGREHHRELMELCHDEGLVFLSTPYSFEDVDFLEELGVPAFKIASGQTVEHPFLAYVAGKGKPIILSTGLCSMVEVEEAVKVIRGAGNNELVVLQCTTDYPAALDDCNLRVIPTMERELGLPAGYSDHTESITAAIVAVGLGATVIERHLTLDRNMPGPDHKSSSDPEEFARLVKAVREASRTLGIDEKKSSDAEMKNIYGVRRSLVSKCDIKAGERFSWDNLTFKRPASGIGGRHSQIILGRNAARDIPADTVISLDMLQMVAPE